MTHGSLFKQYLQSKDISDEAYYEAMRKMGLARNTAQSFILPSTEEIRTPNICMLQALFGVPPEHFGLPADIFRTTYSPKPAEVYCFTFRKEGDNNYRPFVENFFRSVNEHLLSAQERLYVCDYIAKIQGLALKEHVKFYTEQSLIYFEALERILAERKINYWRIAQMPLDYERQSQERGAVFQKFAASPSFDQTPLEEAAEFWFEGMFSGTVGHLYRCMLRHPNQCQFYILLKPFRLHTFYLVDHKVCLTEYHRYDKTGIPVPDTLFVNQCDPVVGETYFESCLQDFERHISTPANRHFRLTDALFLKCAYALEAKLKAAIGNIAEQLREEGENIRQTLRSGGHISAANLQRQHDLEDTQNTLQNRLRRTQKKIEIMHQAHRV
jgi:hypothetical protein